MASAAGVGKLAVSSVNSPSTSGLKARFTFQEKCSFPPPPPFANVPKRYPSQEPRQQQSVDDQPQLVPAKPNRITVHLIVKRNLGGGASEEPQENVAKALGELTHVRLDRENIGEIDGLEVLSTGSLRCLYLQHNCIRTIENLEWLTNLRFLALQYNNIRHVENLKCLLALGFLDLSFNDISEYDIDEFPKSLVILNMQGNPCTSKPYHSLPSVTAALPRLRQLDGCEVNPDILDDCDDSDDGHDENELSGGTISMAYDKGRDEYEEDEEDADGRFTTASDRRELHFVNSSGDVGERPEREVKSGSAVRLDSAKDKGLFSSIGSAIVARSQSRMAELEREHDIRLRELEAIRSRLGIFLDGDRPESGRSYGRHPDEATAARGSRDAHAD